MAVKLHRCPNMWIKVGMHPCWKVQKALDRAGVEYEVVKHRGRRGKREELERLTGQQKLPAIEREDGTVVREESSELAKRVKAGEFGGTAAA